MNEAVHEKLEELNRTPFRKRDGCRLDAYLEEEQAFMKPLPVSEYEPSAWTLNITVGYDYLVSDGRNRYSVPFDLIGEKVDIQLTGTMVEVFFTETVLLSIPARKRYSGIRLSIRNICLRSIGNT